MYYSRDVDNGRASLHNKAGIGAHNMIQCKTYLVPQQTHRAVQVATFLFKISADGIYSELTRV